MDIVALNQVESFRGGIESRGVEVSEEDAHRIILLSFVAAGETIRGSLGSDVDELLEQAHERIDGVRDAVTVIN